jgi:hypothetical protein
MPGPMSLARVTLRTLAWVFLGLLGLLLVLIVGWVPPELAAWLASRPRT